jgi:putative tributyrin esterase
MRKTSICLLFLLLSCGPGLPRATAAGSCAASSLQLRVKDAVFYSVSLQRDMHYRVLLPRDYKNGSRFPVLYLLHGLYGNYQNWDANTGLENYARNLRLLIVMPDADDSWYSNSATVPRDKFEDYIVKDLISEIDDKYRTIPKRHARAVAGLSMGGYGAVKLALQCPGLFAFAGSLSGALNAAQNLDTLRPQFRTKLLEVFGNDGTPTRSENDVFLLLNAPHETPYPYFYLACGTTDFFLDTNRAFVLQLSSRKIAYEYHETAGGHTWEYWDKALRPMLQAIERTIGESSATSKNGANYKSSDFAARARGCPSGPAAESGTPGRCSPHAGD